MRLRNAALAMIWMGAATSSYAQEPLRIVVFDNVGVPEKTLREAVETARTFFRAAQVPAEWNVCRVSSDPSEHCSLPPPGSCLKVSLVPEWKGQTRGGDPMGFALISRTQTGTIAYALLNPARQLSTQTEQPFALVLGCVMAHEIGHLMGLRHRPSGIMKPKLERRDLVDAAMGNLHFTDEDIKTMRALLVGASAATSARF